MSRNRKNRNWDRNRIAATLNSYLDAGGIVAGAGGLALWQSEFGLSSAAIGALGAFSANAFGAAIGALIGGPIVDNKGRIFVVKYSQLVYMLGALSIIFAINFLMLFAGFITLGVGVGIGIPSSWTYLSETSNPEKRARNVGMSQVAWAAGPTIIFTLGVILSPLGLLGNRVLFGVLLLGALLVYLFADTSGESEVMEKIKEENKIEKPENPIRTLFSLKINQRTIAFLVGVYLFWNIVASSMGMFMPYVYENVGGLTNQQANILQAIMWFIIMLSFYFIFARLGDKVNRRKLYGTGGLIGIAAWIILAYLEINWFVLASFVILWGIHEGIGGQGFYALWATELFAPKYRGASQGFMFFLVRALTGLWSLVYPVIIENWGFTVAGTFLIISLIIYLIIGVIWTPDTRGKPLEEITAERYGTKK